MNPDVDERIETLEDKFTTIQSQNASILSKLSQLLKEEKPSRSHTPILSSLFANTDDKPPETKLKPSSPSDFDGDRKKGRAFLNSCELYYRLVPHQFSDEHVFIHWVISFMKSGRASLFADRVLRFESKNDTTKYSTWSEFRQAFVNEFCPKNETQMALAKLETASYHQGKGSVDDYVDDFRELIDQAGYKEDLAIVVKFRKGLNREIQDQIAQLAIGRPSDEDAEAWYEAAIRADENRVANNMFHGSSRSSTAPTRPPTTSTFASFGRTPTAPTWPSRIPTSQPPKPTPTSNPVPMDIDRTRKSADVPDTCRRCGKVGHWAKDCDRRFDIRFMTVDEKDEWIQGLVLEADTKEEDEVQSEVKEDF